MASLAQPEAEQLPLPLPLGLIVETGKPGLGRRSLGADSRRITVGKDPAVALTHFPESP